ncbi:pteridine-dependent deoxygenase, partial [Xanthomonas vesicatoria]
MTAPTLQPNQTVRHPRLRVDYVDQTDPAALLQDAQVLAVFGFGDAAPHLDDPRYLRVPLQPYRADVLEVWRTDAPVRSGRDGNIAWSSDGRLQFGVIEIDERDVE